VVYTDGDFEKCTERQKIKMFGTSEDIKYKEKETMTAVPKKYIIMPEKRFFIVWNIVILLLL